MNTINLKTNYGNRHNKRSSCSFALFALIIVVVIYFLISVPKDKADYHVPDTNIDWSISYERNVYMEYTDEEALMFMINLFQLNAKKVSGSVNIDEAVLKWKGDLGIWNEIRIEWESSNKVVVKSKLGCIPSFWLDDKLEQRYRDAFNEGTIFNLGQIKEITFGENTIIVDLYVEQIEDILPD